MPSTKHQEYHNVDQSTYSKKLMREVQIARDRLTEQMSSSATVNGKRNPDRMLRKILPGMANVCKLSQLVKKTIHTCTLTHRRTCRHNDADWLTQHTYTKGSYTDMYSIQAQIGNVLSCSWRRSYVVLRSNHHPVNLIYLS